MDGELVEAGREPDAASTVAESDDELGAGDAASTVAESDDEPPTVPVGGEKRGREESEESDTQEPEDKKPAFFFKTKCGIVADGVFWDGNSQCMCDLCLG